jgi:hypothetical protein
MKRLVCVLAFCACRSQSTPDAGSSAASASASSAEPEPSSAPSSTSFIPVESDFEDQFLLGKFDAGPSDPMRLTTKAGYDAYANGRYGYTVDVPRSFEPMPDPTNADGRHWRLGRLAAMTVSGKHASADASVQCPHSPDVTGHGETSVVCWATGKHDGWIFWERMALARGTLYVLQIQYVETLKASMDPVAAHVNASWQY